MAMNNINAHGYMRIHTGLFTNTVSFGTQPEQMIIGEALLHFVYSDIRGLLNRANYREEDFSSIHPYFIYCDQEWKDEFIKSLISHDTDSSYITIEDLAELQDGYSSLLVKMFGSSSDFDPKRISRVLYESDEIHSKSCYSLCSVSAKEDGKSYLDYFVTSFEEVLYFELIEMIRRKISVATCKNCGRLFIPRRSNSDYCHRVYTSDGKTCAEIGYAQTFSRSVKNDELLMAYTKAYKAHYARMTKPRKRVQNMTRDEFSMWYREAKEKLNQARAGLIDAEEYKSWLKL